MKILLADDDQDFAKMVSILLKEIGEIHVVHSGTEALEKGRSGEYSCIILDIIFPDMSGCEVARKLREENEVPILLISGLPRSEYTDSILEDPHIVFLEKPFEGEKLKQLLLSLVSKKT